MWVAGIIIPACDSGLLLDAKEASENAMNLRSSGFYGFYFDGDVAVFLGTVKDSVGSDQGSNCGFVDFGFKVA